MTATATDFVIPDEIARAAGPQILDDPKYTQTNFAGGLESLPVRLREA